MQNLDLSPLALFESAGPVVKCVIGVLLLASVWSWVVILETLFGLLRFRRQVKALRSGAAQAVLRQELLKGSVTAGSASRAEILRGHAQEIIVSRQGRLSDLAMITSIAPFIGLFGTVWGIMTSFAAIGSANDTSLATVAPGIAEALATTAYGLAAAIPAAVGQNRLAAGFVRAGISLRAALPLLAAEAQQAER